MIEKHIQFTLSVLGGCGCNNNNMLYFPICYITDILLFKYKKRGDKILNLFKSRALFLHSILYDGSRAWNRPIDIGAVVHRCTWRTVHWGSEMLSLQLCTKGMAQSGWQFVGNIPTPRTLFLIWLVLL